MLLEQLCEHPWAMLWFVQELDCFGQTLFRFQYRLHFPSQCTYILSNTWTSSLTPIPQFTRATIVCWDASTTTTSLLNRYIVSYTYSYCFFNTLTFIQQVRTASRITLVMPGMLFLQSTVFLSTRHFRTWSSIIRTSLAPAFLRRTVSGVWDPCRTIITA